MDERLHRFERDGFVVLERALPRDRVTQLLEAVDDVWAARRAEGCSEPLHELGFIGLDERFVELVDEPAALSVVCDVLGWNVYLYHCHLDVHPPREEPPRWRWHRDGGRQNVELTSPRPRLSVKVAYFLTDVPTPEHGALWVLPGSCAEDTLERSDGSTAPPGATPLLVRAGTAVVFDRRLWHARGSNTADATRKALFLAYTYRWIRPRDALALEPATVAKLDPVRRQLLDAGQSPMGHWIPADEDVPLRALYPRAEVRP